MQTKLMAVGAAAVILAHAAPGLAQSAGEAAGKDAPTIDLGGLWTAERSFDVQLDGPLTVRKVAKGWIAELQGERVDAERIVVEGGGVRWTASFFDLGRFEGDQRDAGGVIEGHWIQPPGPILFYPVATPVRLEPTGEGVHDGEIEPAEQAFSLSIPFVPKTAQADGAATYKTFLRNPDRNSGVFFPIEEAVLSGDDIRFLNGSGELIGMGRVTEPGERFTLRHRGELYEFTRAARHETPGFYPRRSSEPIAELLRPVETGDGWTTARPSETGLDETLILELINELIQSEPEGLSEPYLHSLLVAHKGRLVVEEYFHGHHRDMLHDSRSAGKTIGATLLGMAVHQGAVSDIDQAAYPFFGGVDAFAHPSPAKDRLTIRRLADMTSGLACDDGDPDSPGNEDVMQNQAEELDWYKFALDLPMVDEPGATGVYCTAGINLLGGVVSRATGRSLLRFFHDSLAKPLQIERYEMNLDPLERGYMGGGLRLRPRDFLKIGQLYLDGGVWNGERLLSQDWVRQSAEGATEMSEDNYYGLGWWRYAYPVGDEVVDAFYASGNGGQMLFVAPDLDLAIMMNAGNYSDFRPRNRLRNQILLKAVFPAALGGE